MADDELDLEKGDPERAERISARERRAQRRAGRAGSSGGSSGGGSEKSKDRPTASDSSLSGQLRQTLDRLAKQLDSRHDEELADVLREDAEQIAQGFVALTSGILKPFRVPLVILLNFIGSLLAFWRIGSILILRWADRQQRRREARQQQAEQPEYVDAEVVSP